MGFHPGPNYVLLALADVAELRQVVPQLDDKALADAVRQHPPRRRWKEIVVPDILILEPRDKNRHPVYARRIVRGENGRFGEIHLQDVVLRRIPRELDNEAIVSVCQPLRQIWIQREVNDKSFVLFIILIRFILTHGGTKLLSVIDILKDDGLQHFVEAVCNPDSVLVLQLVWN